VRDFRIGTAGIALLFLSSQHGSFAADVSPTQVTPGPIEELKFLQEETVSIAARHEQPISEAPSNVYVITDEDIRHSGATDIPTVLRRVPGIEVMQVTGADFNVSARGDNQLQANKMLVMVDGRSIYLEGQGIVLWKLLPVTLPEIKRIEVVKGPSSSLYGFNAFDGVINIITKSPDEMKGTTVQFGGGQFGTLTSAAIHAGRQDNFGYRLSFGEDQNQEWRNQNALAFRAYKFNVLTEYDLSTLSKVSLSGGLVDSNRFDGPVVGPLFFASRPSQAYANVGYERPNFFLRAWWTGFTNDHAQTNSNPLLGGLFQATDPHGNPVNNERNDVYNVDAQHTLELGSQFQFNYGVNYRHITVLSPFLPSAVQQNRLGFFGEGEWKVTQKLTAVAGVRYDLHTIITPTISPRVALVYKFTPDHVFRVTLSVGYRPPTPIESFEVARAFVTLPPPFPSPPGLTLVGSRNLSPEEIVSYNAGYQGWFFRHRLRTRVDLFFNHLSNLIVTTQTSPTTATSMNGAGQADIYGGEAGIEFLATPWLSGFANFSYEEIGQSFTGDLTRGAPRFKASGGFRAEWENGLNGETALYHVGAATYPISSPFVLLAPLGVMTPSTQVGSYNLLNIRAGYRFWHEKAELGACPSNCPRSD
jgi:iron complex outermembrane receptor protein